MQRIFCNFAILQATTSEGARNNTKMQPYDATTGIWYAHCTWFDSKA